MTRREAYPSQVADLVARFLTKTEGLPNRAREALALKVYAAFEKIGRPVTEHSEPVYFRSGVLTLKVSESAWLTELTFLKPQLLERLNSMLGRPAVKDIRMRLGDRKKPPEPPAPPKPLSQAQQEAVEDWCSQVADPEVKEAFKRAAERSLAHGPAPGRFVPGPPGPRPPPKQAAPEPEPGLTYGYGDRHEDRWKKKPDPEEEDED